MYNYRRPHRFAKSTPTVDDTLLATLLETLGLEATERYTNLYDIPITAVTDATSVSALLSQFRAGYTLVVDDTRLLKDGEIKRHVAEGFPIIIIRTPREAVDWIEKFGFPKILALDYYLEDSTIVEFLDRLEMALLGGDIEIPKGAKMQYLCHSSDESMREKVLKNMRRLVRDYAPDAEMATKI